MAVGTMFPINGSIQTNTTSFVNDTISLTNDTETDDMMAEINDNIRIATFTLLPVLYTVGMLGNVLTLVVLGSHEITSMASRYILILLACCDMTMLSSHLFNKQGFSQVVGVDVRAFSIIGCKIFFHIYRTTKMMSSWLVVMLCLERFIAVVFPLKVKVFITKRRAIGLIVFTFLFLASFTAVWSFSTTIVKANGKRQCQHDVSTADNRDMSRAFVFIGEAIFLWIPLCFMIGLTPVIIYKLVTHVRLRKQMSNSSSSSGGGSGTARISAMLVAVVIAYVIFILPVTLFHINNSFYNLGVKPNTAAFVIVREVVQYLEMVNYSTNFIMYAFCSVAFRNKARYLICRRGLRPRTNNYTESPSQGTDLTAIDH